MAIKSAGLDQVAGLNKTFAASAAFQLAGLKPVLDQLAGLNKTAGPTLAAMVIKSAGLDQVAGLNKTFAASAAFQLAGPKPVLDQVAGLNKTFAASAAFQLAGLKPVLDQLAGLNKTAGPTLAAMAIKSAGLDQVAELNKTFAASAAFQLAGLNNALASSALRHAIAASIAATTTEAPTEQTRLSSGSAMTVGQWWLLYWSIVCVIFVLALYGELQVLNGPDNWVQATMEALDRLHLDAVYSPATVAVACGQLFKRFVPRPRR